MTYPCHLHNAQSDYPKEVIPIIERWKICTLGHHIEVFSKQNYRRKITECITLFFNFALNQVCLLLKLIQCFIFVRKKTQLLHVNLNNSRQKKVLLIIMTKIFSNKMCKCFLNFCEPNRKNTTYYRHCYSSQTGAELRFS